LGQGEPEPKPANVLLFWVQRFAKMPKKKENILFTICPFFFEKILQTFPKKILNFVWPINLNLKSF